MTVIKYNSIYDDFEVIWLNQNNCDEWNSDAISAGEDDPKFEPGYYYSFYIKCDNVDGFGPYETEEDAANAAYEHLNKMSLLSKLYLRLMVIRKNIISKLTQKFL